MLLSLVYRLVRCLLGTGLVATYSTPTLLRLITGHRIDAGPFITHRFALNDFLTAYEVFGNASDIGALKVVLAR